MNPTLVNPNRRRFMKLSAAGAALAFLPFMGGCNAIQDIENWVPIGEGAIDSIMAILEANNIAISPVIQLAEAAVNAAITDLLSACRAYLATTPPPVGTLQKIQTMLSDVTSSFSNFFAQLNLPQGSSLFSLVTGLVKIVLDTISGFAAQIASPAALRIVGSIRASGVSIPITPRRRTRRKFKKDWNSALDSAKGVQVPAQAYEKLSLLEHL